VEPAEDMVLGPPSSPGSPEAERADTALVHPPELPLRAALLQLFCDEARPAVRC